MLTRTFSSKRPDDTTQEGAPKYKNTSVVYHEFSKDQGDYYLNNYTTSSHRDAIAVKSFIGTDMLDVTDPVLREEIRARESEAADEELSRQKLFRDVIADSKKTSEEKVRELIKAGATSDVVLNALYHLMPRTAPTKDHGHTIERLDWKGQAREHMLDEVDISGYDVEDSSDPDNLPRQRPFTVDEMNRLLQDVEESQFIESDIEDHLFTPSEIMSTMSSMKNSVELRENFRDFVRAAPADTNFEDMTFTEYMNWKPAKAKVKDSAQSDDAIEVMRAQGFDSDFPRNKLEQILLEDAAAWRARREEVFGEPHTIGLHSGQRSFEDVVQYSFHTNPGVGLIPKNTDFTTIPFAKQAQPQAFDDVHDPFADRLYPFTMRVDEVMIRYFNSKEFEKATKTARANKASNAKHNGTVSDAVLESTSDVPAVSKSDEPQHDDVQSLIDEELENFGDDKSAFLRIPIDEAKERLTREGTLLHAPGVDYTPTDADKKRADDFVKTGGLQGYEDLLKDPQFVQMLSRFMSGEYDNVIPAYLREQNVEKKVEMIQPLLAAWSLLRKMEELPVRNWAPKKKVPEGEAQPPANLQDGLLSEEPIDKDAYSRVMGLFEDDPELGDLVKLRTKLSTDLFDPDVDHERKGDFHFEDFTHANTVQVTVDEMQNVATHLIDNDPFRGYFDSVPKNVKRIEYTVDLTGAIDTSGKKNVDADPFKEVRRQLFKANNIHYNHIVSKRKLKYLREGLSRYSGVPEHLLQFLDVFHNRTRGDLGASNPDEARFREDQLHLERLAQPSNALASMDNRPDDSDHENPSISTPIILDGPTHNNTVRRIQSTYQKHISNNPVQKKLDRYKMALITPSDATLAEEASSSGERFVVLDGMTDIEEEFSTIKDTIIVEQAKRLAEAKLHGKEPSDSDAANALFKSTVTDVNDAYMRELITPDLINVYDRLATLPIEDISKFVMNGELPEDFFEGMSVEAKRRATEKLLGRPEPIVKEDVDETEEMAADDVDKKADREEDESELEKDRKEILAKYELDDDIDEHLEHLDPPIYARLDQYDVNPEDFDRDDLLMVGAILRREREMIRAMTAKLQIRTRSDRAALRRIFSISPTKARELVERSILISEGMVEDSDLINPALALQPIVTIGWQKELANLEDSMMGYTNYMNAKTGGLYPGVPSVGHGDNGVYSPPELLTGEFAPLFLDSNLQSSADELVHEKLRLPGYANAVFPAVGTTKFTEVKKEMTIKDNLVNSTKKITDEHVEALEAYEANLKEEAPELFEGIDEVSSESDVAEQDIVTFDDLPSDMKSWVSAFTEASKGTVMNRWSANDFVALLSKLSSIPTAELQAALNSHMEKQNSKTFFTSDPLADNAGAAIVRDELMSTLYHGEGLSSTKRSPAIREDASSPKHFAATYFDETVSRHVLGDLDQQQHNPDYVAPVNGDVKYTESLVNGVSPLAHGVVVDVHSAFDAIANNPKFTEQCKDLPRIALTLRNLFTTRSLVSTFSLKESQHGLVVHPTALLKTNQTVDAKDIFLVDSTGKLLRDSKGNPINAHGITNVEAIAVRENGSLPNGIKLVEELQGKGVELKPVVSSTNDIVLSGYYNAEHGFIPVTYHLSLPQEEARDDHKRIKNRELAHNSDYDPVVYGPSGYPVPPPKPRFTKLAEDLARRHNEEDPFLQFVRWSDDPEYNFSHLYSDVDGPAGRSPELDSERELLTGMFPDNEEKVGSDMSENREYQYIDPLDRPEEDDLARRIIDPTITVTDMMTSRQYNTLQNIYDLRMAKNFFEGRLNPGEYAFVKNNFRLMDKAHDLDTFTDQENDLARIQKEMVVGVVKEWMDDHDIEHYRCEFDAHNVQPDYDPLHQHDDLLNAFAARRFSPYSSMPLSESNIPPLIGAELQKHVYNLHLLDPVTFHPRWIARRLNLTYPAAISLMKVQDMLHKAIMDQGTGVEFQKAVPDNLGARHNEEVSDIEMDPLEDVESPVLDAQIADDRTLAGDTRPANRDFNSDVPSIYPIEQTLDDQSPEHLFSRFAPTLIGRVSWTKNPEKFVGDSAWRHAQSPDVAMLGDEALFDAYHYEQEMNRRWASKEKLLDAMEKAAFSKWGPITWGNYKPGELHTPPKLPREIISTTLHPPSRHNWVLTQLDEAKHNIYAICVRDKEGYLRHPTYREFRNVRLREKDRRLPFYWRRHHVLGKLPQISNLFVEQVHALKKQMADQYMPPGDHKRINEAMAEAYDLKNPPADDQRIFNVQATH